LSELRKGLTELAELLLEKEVIFSEDLERIFGKRKGDRIKEEKEAAAKPSLQEGKPEKGVPVDKQSEPEPETEKPDDSPATDLPDTPGESSTENSESKNQQL
jgi:cell division protease FtsH